MAEVVYVLCALTSVACAFLLVSSYRKNRTRLLLWSSLCFVGLAINNALLFVDLVAVPSIDLSIVRACTGLVSVVALLVGLIWSERVR
jgi:hydrogenase/urease accessory protein HupE